jgi:chromosome segregation ATPase
MGKIKYMSQLTPEELESVKELQSKYNQTVFEIGVAETQILTLEKQIAKLRDDKTALIGDLETIETKEAALVATLQTVYGTGAINPESGEITPVQQ